MSQSTEHPTTTGIPNPRPVSSNLSDAVPSTADDGAQNLARTMAMPLLAMGLMTVVIGFAAGIAGGVNFGNAFSPSGVASDLGRGEALVQVTGATLFLGMGLILGGITMTLVNVARSLRDAGRDVQEALHAEPVQLAKPKSALLTPPVMMMGVMIEVAAFVIGIVAATTIGGVAPAAIGGSPGASAGDVADVGLVRALSAWLPGLRLVGLALILVSVVLVLSTIKKAIRFQGDRISELAEAA